VVSLNFTSWNQLDGCLRLVGQLRAALYPALPRGHHLLQFRFLTISVRRRLTAKFPTTHSPVGTRLFDGFGKLTGSDASLDGRRMTYRVAAKPLSRFASQSSIVVKYAGTNRCSVGPSALLPFFASNRL
jgi:hypothetical protein